MMLERVEKAQRALDRARTAMQAHMPEQAMEHLDQAQLLAPDLEPLWLLRAQIALALNRPTEALNALDSLDFYYPKKRYEPAVMMTRGEALLRSNRDDLAQSLLEKLVAEFPADVRPRRMLAGLCLKQRDARGAIEHLRAIARLAPADAAGLRRLARVLAAVSPADCIEQLSQTPPDAWDAGLRLQMARLLRDTDRLREAEDQYAALLLECADDAALWSEAGELADTLGAADVAAERLRKAAQLNPRERRRPMALLAKVLMHAGATATAGRVWHRLLRDAPDDAAAAAGLLVCAQVTGHDRLVRFAEQRLAEHASRAERQHLLARLWQHAATGQVINRVQDNAPRPDAPGRSPLSAIIADSAATLASHAQARPERADTHDHRAVLCRALGEAEPARQHVRTALKINPGYRAVHYLLELIEGAPERAAA